MTITPKVPTPMLKTNMPTRIIRAAFLSALPAAEIGDEVTLIGPSLDAQAMAGHCGTITYEVLSRISSRVPRVYRAP